MQPKNVLAHEDILISSTESRRRFRTVVEFMTKLNATRISPLQLFRMFTFVGALLIGFCSSHDSCAGENVDVGDAYHGHL